MTAKHGYAARFSRLAQTSTFRDAALARWLEAYLIVIGAGNLGQRVAMECLLSGVGSLVVCDFARTKEENLGTQFGAAAGHRKVDNIVNWAKTSAPGKVLGLFCDARQIGIGQLDEAQLLIDCTDDPQLALPLTTISNGLGIPLLRPALDGSGGSELGRVACSHGGAGYGCQLCTWEVRDLFRHTERTPCQPHDRARRPPTLAGGAIGATIAGITVLQSQRLVTRNDLDDVLDREWIVDLSSGQLLTIRRQRSTNCLSGHVRWELMRLPHHAAEITWRELFAIAEKLCGSKEISLEPFSHALCVELVCECGCRREAVGTRWAKTPHCPRCKRTMKWARETCRHRITRHDLAELQLADNDLADTGMPPRGAMFVARKPGKPPLRIVLS